MGGLEPRQKGFWKREDLAPAGFSGRQRKGLGFQVDVAPLEARQVAQALAGIEPSQDEPFPFGFGDGEDELEFLDREGASLGPLASGSDGGHFGGRILVDEAIAPRLLESDAEDFQPFVDRAARQPLADLVPIVRDLRGGERAQILQRPVPKVADKFSHRRFIDDVGGRGHGSLPERGPASEVVLHAGGFETPAGVVAVDVGDHFSRLRFGQVVI